MIRVGIVGTGAMAGWHARGVAEARNARLVACHDVDCARAGRFAQDHDVPLVADSLDALIDACDVVAVVTPDRFHAEMSIRILRAGRHLMCEKPLTVTLAETRKVLRAYERAHAGGARGAINFTHRTHADFAEALRLVRSGAIGALRHARIHYLQGWLACGRSERWKAPTNLWRLQRAAGSGGVLGDLGCHLLDYLTAFTGPPRQLHCTLRTHAKQTADGTTTRRHRGRLDASDTAVIQLDLGADALASAESTRWASGSENRFELEIYGTEGGVRCGHGDTGTYVRLHRAGARGATEWREVRQRARYPGTWQRLLRAIERGEDPEPDIARGAEIQALLHACERSAASGRWVAPPRLASRGAAG